MSIAMEKHKIVPNVIPVAPPAVAKITYINGLTVELGNELTPRQTKDEPKVEWNASSSDLYTLYFGDLDGPASEDPPGTEWVHWLVGNIPGQDVAKGDTIISFIGSGPDLGTGLHRYAYWIFKQNGKLNFDEPRISSTVIENRNILIANFTKKYNLGNPVAGNFYLSQWDDYVPILEKLILGTN